MLIEGNDINVGSTTNYLLVLFKIEIRNES